MFRFFSQVPSLLLALKFNVHESKLSLNSAHKLVLNRCVVSLVSIVHDVEGMNQ